VVLSVGAPVAPVVPAAGHRRLRPG